MIVWANSEYSAAWWDLSSKDLEINWKFALPVDISRIFLYWYILPFYIFVLSDFISSIYYSDFICFSITQTMKGPVAVCLSYFFLIFCFRKALLCLILRFVVIWVAISFTLGMFSSLLDTIDLLTIKAWFTIDG